MNLFVLFGGPSLLAGLALGIAIREARWLVLIVGAVIVTTAVAFHRLARVEGAVAAVVMLVAHSVAYIIGLLGGAIGRRLSVRT